MRQNKRFIICLLAGITFFASCFKTEIPIPPPPPSGTSSGSSGPTVSGISPSEGPLATPVTITGTGFNVTLSLDTVYFNGKQAVVTSATATQLVVTVPTGAGTGVVSVDVKGVTESGPTFTYDYTYQVTTLAGGNSNLVDGTGTGAGFGVLNGITNDGNGNLYVGDMSLGTIRKITTDKGVVTTIAGTGMVAADADGTLATAAFATPSDIIVSGSTLYVLDGGSGSNCGSIRMISGNNVTTIAGGGSFGATNGTGTGAHFGNLWGFARDANGNFYVPDPQYYVIREVTAAGVETTFAGVGGSGYYNATGTQAVFNQPSYVAIDASGNIFVSDVNNSVIREITPAGVVTTFAGSGTAGSADGTGTAASFNLPADLAFDKNGNLYLADEGNNKIRKITPAGVVTTIAGSGAVGTADGSGATAQFGYPTGVTVDPSGTIYVADGSNMIRKIGVQ
jgi:serine/threonine protein kinase, bacterial